MNSPNIDTVIFIHICVAFTNFAQHHMLCTSAMCVSALRMAYLTDCTIDGQYGVAVSLLWQIAKMKMSTRRMRSRSTTTQQSITYIPYDWGDNRKYIEYLCIVYWHYVTNIFFVVLRYSYLQSYVRPAIILVLFFSASISILHFFFLIIFTRDRKFAY